MADGAERIAAERRRQIDELGWDPQHDTDANPQGEMAWAAVCYAAPGAVFCKVPLDFGLTYCFTDPWPEGWDKGSDKRVPRDQAFTETAGGPTEVEARVRELEKAGALIAAEIDRLTGEGT